MKIQKVVDFRTFHKLNEEEEMSKSIGAADQIVDLFFQAYNGIVSKIGGYGDAVKDLTQAAEAEGDKKGQVMLDVINKIASKVDPKFSDAANEMVLAGKKIKEAYDTLIATEDGKKDLEKINDKMYKKLINQIDSLKTAASQAPKVEVEKKNESLEYTKDSALFEFFDKTFTNEREELSKKIVPIYATIVNLMTNSPSAELKAKCSELEKKLKGFMTELGSKNEKAWEEMKRKQRKERLEQITNEVNNVPSELQEVQTKVLVKLGIDKKVEGLITGAAESIKSAMDMLGKEEEQKLETSAEKKSEEAKEEKEGKKGGKKEESKEGGEKEEIVSGTVDASNLKKAGKNREAIRDAQKKINMLLSPDAQIKDDGLYGKNTEEAIKKIASQYSSIAPDIKGLDGKKMTPAFRKFLDNFEKNKEKIASLFK